jgi:hypothetical protein
MKKKLSPIAAENLDENDFKTFVQDLELMLSGFKQVELYTLMGTGKSSFNNRIYGREPISKTFLDNFYVKLKPLILGRRAGKSAYEIKAELVDAETEKVSFVGESPQDPSLLEIYKLLTSIQASNQRIEKALKIDPPGGESSGESIPQGN